MIEARKNPVSGHYVLSLGVSRGLVYYLNGQKGIVDVWKMPYPAFKLKYPESLPGYVATCIRMYETHLPEGWVISPQAGVHLQFLRDVLRKNPSFTGELTMAALKSQPKLTAKVTPATAPAAPAKPEKPLKKAPAPVPETPSDEGTSEGKGRACPYAGMKIVVVSKEIKAREGSLRSAVLAVILGAKKVDDVLGQEVNGDDGKSAKINTAWLTFAKNAGNVDFQ